MLRRTKLTRHPVSKPSRPPHVILGLSPDASEEQVKERFHQLARQHHPDMPGGSTQKFKEVNAAYTLLKIQRAKGIRHSEADDAPSSAEPDPLTEKMKEHMKRYHEDRERGRPKTTAEMMWDDEVYEIILLCGSWVVAFFIIVDRFFSAVDSAWRKELLRGAMATASSGVVPQPSAQAVASAENERESYLSRQRRSQQRFADLREFFLIYDTDHVVERKLTSQRIATELVDESRIHERCPIVRVVDSSKNPSIFASIAMNINDDVLSRNWYFVDAGPTTALLVEAAKRVDKLSPAEHRITFFEYQSDTGKDAAPRCMVAVVNNRFLPGTGRTQRLTATGQEVFEARLALSRIGDLESGRLKPDDLILPGWIPLTDKKA